ncbi:MAG TPA: MFS transporter [Woeseiaceae bacterium]|nr:MFS transporter [Woeseiaceae bacterium]
MPYKLLERVLGVEKRETVAVAWSFAYFFCVLSSYYMLRPIREMLGVASGVTTVPVLFTSTFLAMIAATTIFGWVASKFPRRVFLPWVYAFFVLNILFFYGAFLWAEASATDFVWIGRVFFVWISIFNLFVVSVFWSFMADIYTREQGRRLFGVISAGGSIGALAGPAVTIHLVDIIGFERLLPLSAALLLGSIVCIGRLRRWVERAQAKDVAETAAAPKPLGGSAFAGMTHVFRSRYFIAISVVSVLASLLGTALYMFMNALVGETIADADARTKLFAYLDLGTGMLTVVFQLLVVRHAVRKLGLGMTFALMPLLSVVGFALLAVHPTLLFVAVLQALRRAVGFGFSKPANDMLYSVVTPEEKYKAKNFIDTAVYRAGDLVGTWTIRAVWGLGMTGIALALLPFAILWVLIALWLGREYRRRARSGRTIEEQRKHDERALEST